MYENILVPTDGSEEGVGSSLRHALSLAQKFGSKLHVLYVSDSKIEDNSMFMGEKSPVGKDATQKVKNEAERYGVQTRTEVTHGDPADEIMDYATKHAIDLIVMGTHGRTGISRVLEGSVTEKVVRNCNKPVLAVERGE